MLKTQERFGSAYVCDVLAGSRQKRILENRHDQLSVHGLLSKMPKPLVREYVQLLEQEGYLNQDQGAYPVLRVSPLGRRALRDRLAIELPKPQTVVAAVSSKKSSALGGADAELFEALRALRKDLASKQGVPPFVIFGDKTLHDMASSRPQTDREFLDLFGVGERKLEQYGKMFMECIRDHSGPPPT